jgi:hypothetical protein
MRNGRIQEKFELILFFARFVYVAYIANYSCIKLVRSECLSCPWNFAFQQVAYKHDRKERK